MAVQLAYAKCGVSTRSRVGRDEKRSIDQRSADRFGCVRWRRGFITASHIRAVANSSAQPHTNSDTHPHADWGDRACYGWRNRTGYLALLRG